MAYQVNRKWHQIQLPTGIFIAVTLSGMFYLNCVGVEEGGPGFPYTIFPKFPYGGSLGQLAGLIFSLPADLIVTALAVFLPASLIESICRIKPRIHLLTLVILTFAAGGIIWQNLPHQGQLISEDRGVGWPFLFFDERTNGSRFNLFSVYIDAVVAFFLLYGVAGLCEAYQIEESKDVKGNESDRT